MREYSFSELKESRILMDKKPPRFGVIIILITLFFLVLIIILAGISAKTYVVKANSIVTSDDKTYVMPSVSGEILEVFFEEGEYVNIGETLFTINSSDVILQINQVKKNKEYITLKSELISKLIKYINVYNIDDIKTTINPFDKNNATEAKEYLSALKFDNYIKSQIEDANKLVGTDLYVEFNQDSVNNLKFEFLAEPYSILEQYTMQQIDYQSRIDMYEGSLDNYIIKASNTGIVHFNSDIYVGTVLQTGSLVGSISSDDTSKLYFDTIVSSTDISKIDIGDDVEIALSGVLQSEFGILKGSVVSISTDSTQTEDGQVFYKIKVLSDQTKLEDNKGNVVNINTGMIAECRIKYDETTWLKWAIEQIGVKFR